MIAWGKKTTSVFNSSWYCTGKKVVAITGWVLAEYFQAGFIFSQVKVSTELSGTSEN